MLGILLRAIGESVSPKTMRLEGTINNNNVLILIGTKSTHNFLVSYVATKAKLQVRKSNF